MEIDTLDAVTLGSSRQWIRVRGMDRANPILLLVQQGPGLPMINEVARFERTLGLERDFRVVYWDQRRCGLSLRGPSDPAPASIDGMASDTVELLETLRDRFGAPAHVVGFSTGATVAAIAAARRPDLLRVLVGVGMDVDGAEAGRVVYDVVLARARATGNRRAVRQLERIGPPPHVDPHSFSTRFRWAAEFGAVSAQETYATTGRRLVASLLRSPDYSLRDAVRTLRAVVAPQVALLEEIASINLRATVPRIDVPVVLVQGRLDRIAPGDAAERYLAALRAPRKELVWFEHSAHTPQLDEPQAFRALLRRIRNGQGEEHERVA